MIGIKHLRYSLATVTLFSWLELPFCQGTLPTVSTATLSPDAIQTPDLLDMKVSMSVNQVPVYEIVRALRNDNHVAISFIDADVDSVATTRISLDLKNVTLGQLLKEIISTLPIYTFTAIEHHLILFPDIEKYRLPVHNIEIRSIDRSKAVVRYIAELARQYPSFGQLLPPVIKGNAGATLYAEEVSLSKEGTVLEHFVELLGKNPKVVFSILKTRSGAPMYVLDLV